MYAVGRETLTWGDARTKCKTVGGELVSIGDREEQEFFTANVVPEADHYWIGFTDQPVEGQWEWTDG